MSIIDPEIRRLAHERAGGYCERCGKLGERWNWELHIHHLTYVRHGHELLTDVVVICLACHGKEHPHHIFRTRRAQSRVRKRKPQRGKWDIRQARNALRRAAAELNRK